MQIANEKKRTENHWPRVELFNKFPRIRDRIEDLERLDEIPDEFYVTCYHRRFSKPYKKIFHDLVPQLIASPILLILPWQMTGRRLYQEVWASA